MLLAAACPLPLLSERLRSQRWLHERIGGQQGLATQSKAEGWSFQQIQSITQAVDRPGSLGPFLSFTVLTIGIIRYNMGI